MSPTTTRNKFRLALLVFTLAAGVVLVDQGTKAAALSQLSQHKRLPLLGDFLGLQLAFNPGAILSLGSEFTSLLTALGVAMTVALVIAATRARTVLSASGIGLILGGAIGNLIDRLFASPGFGIGHVTDFLAYGNWFIGNLADVALGIGVAFLVSHLWISRNRANRPEAPPVAPRLGTTIQEVTAP